MHCPHCDKFLDDAPDLAGQLVSCPFCSQQFTMPGAAILPPANPINIGPPSHVAPPINIMVQREAPREKRLEAKGWFARSFGVASGAMTGIIVVAFTCVVLSCGGCLLFTYGIGRGIAVVEERVRDEALKQSAIILKRRGIVDISNDSTVSKIGPTVTVDGHGRDRDHRISSVRIVFTVAQFGNNENWQLDEIEIDGRRVYP